jgi:hypothetical protein
MALQAGWRAGPAFIADKIDLDGQGSCFLSLLAASISAGQ